MRNGVGRQRSHVRWNKNNWPNKMHIIFAQEVQKSHGILEHVRRLELTMQAEDAQLPVNAEGGVHPLHAMANLTTTSRFRNR